MSKLPTALRSTPVVVLAGFLCGAVLVWALPESWLFLTVETPQAAGTHAHAERWACPMQCVILDGPGVCPVCGMDLEKLDASGAHLELNAHERKMIGLRTAPVTRRELHHTLETFGRVGFNERRVKTVSAWVPGRIVRLYANTTYSDIRRGDHVFELYSPELYAAQSEYLSAWRQSRSRDDGFVSSARAKLRLFGLTEGQIDALEKSGKAETTVEIKAPASGKIIELRVKEGDWVAAGAPIYAIADFSSLWLRFDAYEQDLPWIAVGQPVQIELEAFPGQQFDGSVEYIEDAVDERTRTVKVRVILDNPEGQIKPGMFATVRVHAMLGPDGRVAPPPLAGRYTCYMHPEVRRDSPGECPICEMELELAVDSADPAGGAAPTVLSVPRSAVLDTGARQLVYRMSKPPRFEQRGDAWVEVEPMAFEPVSVHLGPPAGDDVMVVSGLSEGDVVARSGAMLIDSQMELTGRPSLASPEGGAAAPPSHH
jgi:Cu(I)/Ag(I) efflux system membrane fusion protein